jgi:hypothetical protein
VIYDPAAWHDFFVMLGGAAAALTGLVFVALSLHLDRVVANPFHRFRAGISVAGLTSMVILSGAALVPTQSHQAFGLEVLANAAIFFWLNVTASRPTLSRFRYGFSPANAGPRPPSRLLYGLTVTVAYTLAGLFLFFGSGVGFLILAVALASSLTAGIKTAWDLMVELREEPASGRRR